MITAEVRAGRLCYFLRVINVHIVIKQNCMNEGAVESVLSTKRTVSNGKIDPS
jgi:hypothetical protein